MTPSYHRPASVNEALQLKAKLGPGTVFLAGGTEVNNLHAPRPAALIDLSGLGLNKIEATPAGLRIGAGVTFQQLIEYPDVPAFIKKAAGHMANRNIRNCATVGGQLGANKTCANLIPALMAAEARVVLTDREVPVDQFVAGGEHRDRGPGRDRQPLQAQRRRQRDVHGIEPGPRPQHRVAGPRVLAGLAHVRARANAGRHGHCIRIDLRVLAHHHGIRACRHRRTGGDAHAVARADLGPARGRRIARPPG